MKKIILLSAILSALVFAEDTPTPQATVEPVVVTPIVVTPVIVEAPKKQEKKEEACAPEMDQPTKQMSPNSYNKIRINVTGQGVAPTMTSSPAQAYALAKRAAIADAYRLLAEKVKGVRVEGSDKIKNMMVQRSEVRTFVDAVIAEAEIIETVFKDGLCEVEMELTIDPKQWRSILAAR